MGGMADPFEGKCAKCEFWHSHGGPGMAGQCWAGERGGGENMCLPYKALVKIKQDQNEMLVRALVEIERLSAECREAKHQAGMWERLAVKRRVDREEAQAERDRAKELLETGEIATADNIVRIQDLEEMRAEIDRLKAELLKAQEISGLLYPALALKDVDGVLDEKSAPFTTRLIKRLRAENDRLNAGLLEAVKSAKRMEGEWRKAKYNAGTWEEAANQRECERDEARKELAALREAVTAAKPEWRETKYQAGVWKELARLREQERDLARAEIDRLKADVEPAEAVAFHLTVNEKLILKLLAQYIDQNDKPLSLDPRNIGIACGIPSGDQNAASDWTHENVKRLYGQGFVSQVTPDGYTGKYRITEAGLRMLKGGPSEIDRLNDIIRQLQNYNNRLLQETASEDDRLDAEVQQLQEQKHDLLNDNVRLIHERLSDKFRAEKAEVEVKRLEKILSETREVAMQREQEHDKVRGEITKLVEALEAKADPLVAENERVRKQRDELRAVILSWHKDGTIAFKAGPASVNLEWWERNEAEAERMRMIMISARQEPACQENKGDEDSIASWMKYMDFIDRVAEQSKQLLEKSKMFQELDEVQIKGKLDKAWEIIVKLEKVRDDSREKVVGFWKALKKTKKSIENMWECSCSDLEEPMIERFPCPRCHVLEIICDAVGIDRVPCPNRDDPKRGE